MDRPKIGVKNLSIVNGAQTCGALFRAISDYDRDFGKFDHLSLSFRLYETDDLEFVDEISICSNSQNRVHPRDLKANDKYQLDFEKALAENGITYLRKRGQITDVVGTYQLDALKAGQILLSYFQEMPERAKRDSELIFDSLYDSIFSSIDVQRFLHALKIFDLILEKRDIIEDEVRIRGRRVENDFVTYGVFHILYVCKLLESRHVTDNHALDALVSQAIEIVAGVLKQQNYPAHYTFFRDPRSKKLMSDFGRQGNLFDYL